MVNRLVGRAGIAMASLLDAARPRARRRIAAATKYRTPTSGALAPPVPETLRETVNGHDGNPIQIFATTSPGNQISGERPPPEHPNASHLDSPGTLSIAEGSGHPANQKSRPIAWIIVAFIALAFVAAGLGLVLSAPWLFIAGLAAVVAGGIAAWAAGIMADRGDANPTGVQRSSKI